MNSCIVRVKAKTTTVRRPGTERGRMTFTIAPRRLHPSTMACSSMSWGTDLKKPMSSHVQKGMVKVGYISMSEPRDS